MTIVLSAEARKHELNDPKCSDLGFHLLLTRMADGVRLLCENSNELLLAAVRTRVLFSAALTSLYNTLGVVLARQNARAILARLSCSLVDLAAEALGAREVHQFGSCRS